MAQIIHFPVKTTDPQRSLVDQARTDTLEKRRLAKLFGLKTVILPKGDPQSGELWKSRKVGSQGPRIYLVLSTSKHKDGTVTVGWVARGELGAGPLESFKEGRVRIGWLGDVPSK